MELNYFIKKTKENTIKFNLSDVEFENSYVILKDY